MDNIDKFFIQDLGDFTQRCVSFHALAVDLDDIFLNKGRIQKCY